MISNGTKNLQASLWPLKTSTHQNLVKKTKGKKGNSFKNLVGLLLMPTHNYSLVDFFMVATLIMLKFLEQMMQIIFWNKFNGIFECNWIKHGNSKNSFTTQDLLNFIFVIKVQFNSYQIPYSFFSLCSSFPSRFFFCLFFYAPHTHLSLAPYPFASQGCESFPCPMSIEENPFLCLSSNKMPHSIQWANEDWRKSILFPFLQRSFPFLILINILRIRWKCSWLISFPS